MVLEILSSSAGIPLLAFLVPILFIVIVIVLDRSRGGIGREVVGSSPGIRRASETERDARRTLHRLFESLLLSTRWILAPFLIILNIGLLVLLYDAVEQVWAMFTEVAHQHHVIILGLLKLIDVTLEAALVILVIIAVYDIFVSKVQKERPASLPDWIGQIGFPKLKLRLLSTIVTISAIQLLEAFLKVPEINDRELYFYIAIYLTFVATTVAFALAERLEDRGEKKSEY